MGGGEAIGTWAMQDTRVEQQSTNGQNTGHDTHLGSTICHIACIAEDEWWRHWQ